MDTRWIGVGYWQKTIEFAVEDLKELQLVVRICQPLV